jgi:hypothetical protein
MLLRDKGLLAEASTVRAIGGQELGVPARMNPS